MKLETLIAILMLITCGLLVVFNKPLGAQMQMFPGAYLAAWNMRMQVLIFSFILFIVGVAILFN